MRNFNVKIVYLYPCMQKKGFNIFISTVLLLGLMACNSEKKVYESTEKEKKKDKSIAIGKYNKLLKSGDMELKYTAAVAYFKKQDYARALSLFEELVGVFRGTARGEEVMYYHAYCEYNLDDYILAGYHFRTYVRQFPNGKHAEECAYMNAYCYYLSSPQYSLDQSDTKLAIKEFQKFTNQYPKSERIPECNQMLDKLWGKLERKSYENAMLYYNTYDYKAAISAFGNHIKEFPNTTHLEELNYLIIRSYYLLALNSIDAKKQERFKASVDAYLKYVDKFPNGKHLKEAEIVYSSALKNLEKI
ncbi:MAG: outer membrane protein assembly factor BamD [Bacteroidia bacterium]